MKVKWDSVGGMKTGTTVTAEELTRDEMTQILSGLDDVLVRFDDGTVGIVDEDDLERV
jgi:hypothetical protein